MTHARFPLLLAAAANDYGSCCDQYYTSFNGGASWTTGNMSTGSETNGQ
jgi:hypothetical protein